jgi:hypothetical protein
MQIQGGHQVGRYRLSILIVFVLLRGGDMRVYDGFEDVTEEYLEAQQSVEREEPYEPPYEDPEAPAEAEEYRSSDQGVLSEPTPLLRKVRFSYEGPFEISSP